MKTQPRTFSLVLPRLFWEDHRDRDLPSGRLTCDLSPHRVGIEATLPEAKELLSDAAYYASKDGPDELPKGLKKAARQTVDAIARTLNKECVFDA